MTLLSEEERCIVCGSPSHKVHPSDEEGEGDRCPICGSLMHIKHPPIEKEVLKPPAKPKELPPFKPVKLFGFSVKETYARIPDLSKAIVKKFDLDSWLEKAQLPISPEGYAAVALTYTIFSGIACTIIGLLLAIVLGSALPLALILAPLGVFFLMMQMPRFKASSRADKFQTEFPVLATYAAMAGSAGIPVYNVFKTLASSPSMLAHTKAESCLIVRDSEVFTKNPILTFERLAKRHPSERFREWLAGLLYTLRVGGNVVRYLEVAADRSLRQLSESWRKFSNFAMTFGDITVTFFALLPLSLFVLMIGLAGIQSLNIITLYSFVMSPIAAVFLIILIHASMPSTPESLTRYYMLTMFSAPIAAGIAAVAVFVLQVKIYIAFGLALMLMVLPSTLKFEIDNLREKAIERDIPRFLYDVTESKRIGQPLERALISIATRGGYAKPLQEIVRRLAWNVRMGNSIPKAIEIAKGKLRSWYANIMFFLFQEAYKTGGGTVRVFERLTRFAQGYYDLRKKIKSDLRIHIGIFYATAVIVVFTISQVLTYAITPQAQLAGEIGTSTFMFGFIPSMDIVKSMTTTVLSGVMLNSFVLGLLGGKITEGSIVAGFKHCILAVLITIVAIIFSGFG